MDMRYLQILAMALLIPTAAMAKGDCKEDKKKFCEGLEKKELQACMEKHAAELSAACKASREEKAKAREARGKQTKKAADAAKEGGARTEPSTDTPPAEGNASKPDQPEQNAPNNEASPPN
jgi:hypothetical protein